MAAQCDLRWLLVGTGDIVHKRVGDALRSAAGSRIAGVVGGGGRAAEIAGEFGGEPYDDLDRALAQCDADAVYIATPVYRHAPEALRAIAADRHVLIEKPLALDGAEAQQIAAAAAARGVTAGCAYYRRCYPRFIEARRAIATGELGVITQVRMHYQGWFNPANDDAKFWRVDPARSGGGPLADNGSHMLDLLIGLVGLPQTAYARSGNLVHDYQVEDFTAVLMTLATGAPVMASFAWNTRNPSHEMDIVGSDMSVRWSPLDSGPVMVNAKGQVQPRELPNAANLHLPLVADFVQAVRHRRPPVCPLSEAVKTSRLIDAIHVSARHGKPVVIGQVGA